MEANVQGLVSSKASRKRENQGKSNSISQASFQGNITALNKATLTAKYIRNAIEIQQAGLIKGKTERAQENQLKQKSGQVSSYQGITRSYAATNKHAHDWKEWMSQTRYLQFPGMVKVNTQLISNLNNLRLSYRQAKFEINKQSRVESWWAFLWKKPLDQRKAPPPLRKPRYDPHEHEIWNY